MLVDGNAVTEPCNVADIEQDRGRSSLILEVGADFFTEQVFVANVDRNALPLPDERGLRKPTPAEVAQRNAHHVGEPAKDARYELTEWHQVVFVITPVLRIGIAGNVRTESDDRVAVFAAAIPQGHTDNRRLGSTRVSRRNRFEVTGR